ncbi:CPCC family cysteine-rich protein [Microbacterium sp. A8/3-1]|uniref:CPCC family cysteine-rich protein n=1 Tax=Microbacterium sp. A8/3-1 TaxID=3160749 RepID=A0AAU7VZM0_9MICO
MYPCACCGYLTLSGPPGSYEICDVCWWEDDAVQLRYPELRGGANHPSLVEAQATFQAHGSSDLQLSSHTRPPRSSDALDSGWRLLDTSRDDYEKEFSATPMPDDFTALYWWRPTYWRR